MFIEIWALPTVRDVLEFGKVRVDEGYDYTNAVVSVAVGNLNPNAVGTKLVVTARNTSGKAVATRELAITAAGEYAFDLGGLVPGAAYVFEVTATNDASAAALAVETARVADLGHPASSNAWIKADEIGTVNGVWATTPVFENGSAEVGTGAGLRFDVECKAEAGKLTVVESVIEFNTPVDAADFAALDLAGVQSALTPADDCWKAWNGTAWIALTGCRTDPGRWIVRSSYDYADAAPRVAYAVKREGEEEFTWLRTAEGAYWFTCGSGVDAKRLSGIDYRCGGRFVSHVGNGHEPSSASAPLAEGTREQPVTLFTNVTWPHAKSGTYFIDRNGHTLLFPDKNVHVKYGFDNRVMVTVGNGLVIYIVGGGKSVH